MFTELLSSLPSRFEVFAPFKTASDRAFWETLPGQVARAVLAGGDALLEYRFPPLPATLYRDFSRTGNRTRFEEPYFARRRALNSLVLAECVRADGRYLDRIIDGIDALCSESAWQLPAHNSYVRDTKQLPLPDTSRPVLDLFACETGAQLSMISFLLADSLDRESPSIRNRVERLVRERILDPYLHEHFWWMGNGDEPMCNWTPWCTQNVLLCAALLSPERAVLEAVMRKAAYGLDCFLKDYGDDGCCSEGAQYYRHAGLTLFGATEILDSLAPGVFSPLYRVEKVRNIALYILNVHVADEYYVNFADCSPIAGRAGVREYLFGKRIASPELTRFAAADAMKREDPILSGEINLCYRVQEIAAAREIAEAAAELALAGAPADKSGQIEARGNAKESVSAYAGQLPDVWYPSVGLFVSRSTSFCLAVKAGGNGDSHNHNDTGSFTLYKNGQPCFIDAGVETYTAKTFSPDRYEIWTMQSAWHNLPTFGPFMQSDGAAYRASDVRVSQEPKRSSISMELAGAWKAESGVRSCRRSVDFDKASGMISITDEYAGEHEPVLSLMTALEPVVSRIGEGALVAIGNLARLEVNAPPDRITIEPVDIADARLRTAWGERIWRIRIRCDKTVRMRIT